MKALLATLLPIGCLLALGLEPLVWLIGTWHQPGYEGIGFWAFGATVALLCWSASSPAVAPDSGAMGLQSIAPLLLCSLLIRLLGALTGVSLISALVLAIDMYALARWLGTDVRRRAVAPLWLAAVFCFSLPVEPLLQRTLGFALQQVSALFACGLLDWAGFNPQCQGVRLQIAQTDVLVDLPCSGARLASFGGLIFALLAALRNPAQGAAAVGLVLLIALVALGNALRIALLAIGIAYASQLPVSVMAEPWHSLIGVLTLTAVAAGLWVWFDRTASTHTPAAFKQTPPQAGSGALLRTTSVLVAALVLPWLQLSDHAVTTQSAHDSEAWLPEHLGGYARRAEPLGALESSYFRRYGASAMRSTYGPHGLYVVRTDAPLRHLHAPEICLRGLGHRVEFLGTAFDGVPRSQFRSIDQHGNIYRVDVTYVSESGVLASSIAEVIWRWVQDPRQSWTMIQRVTPAHVRNREFEHAVHRAFNLPIQATI